MLGAGGGSEGSGRLEKWAGLLTDLVPGGLWTSFLGLGVQMFRLVLYIRFLILKNNIRACIQQLFTDPLACAKHYSRSL